MKAIILAAGLGSRLKPLTDTVPKCLTEINGQPILVNALKNLESSGVTEVIVVIGYLKDKIQEKIGAAWGRMKISYVENEIYDKTNTSYSLWLGLKNVNNEDIVLLEGDVFFEKKLLIEFLKSSSPNATTVEKYNPTLDGSFVALKENRVVDWIYKTKRPANFTIVDKFKTVNIHKFSASFVTEILKPTLQKHVEASQGSEPLEYVMQDIVTSKATSLKAFLADGMQWFEIDDLKDLEVAEKIFAKPSLDAIRSLHGGYWRHDHLDFHYLFNHYFPTAEVYAELARQLPIIGNYYPSSQKTLAQLLSKWKDADYFTADNLIIGNGSSELIRLLNDHVITKITVPLPTYNEFVRLPDEKINKYVLDEANSFAFDPGKLLQEVNQSQSEYAVVINPNNPVGNLTSLAAIETVLKAGVTLIVDESFIVFAGAKYSAEQLVPRYKNLVVVTSCTKSIGIAGLRLGYLLTSNEAIKEKLRYHIPIWNINSLTEHLIEIFPNYQKEHEESIIKSMADTRWFFAGLQAISYLEPYPTFANAVFCKVQGSSRQLAEILYDKYNLMVKEGLNQKEIKTDAYIRLGVRNRQDNEKLLAALKEIDQTKILQPASRSIAQPALPA